MNHFSLVMSWRDRPELARTLAANAALFTRYCHEMTIVNCGGDPEQLSGLIRDQPIAGVRQVHIPDTAFNWALSNNIGTLCSSGPYLCFLDADVILKSDIFGAAYRLLQLRKCFVKVRTVYESEPPSYEPWPGIEEMATTHAIRFKNGKKATLKLFTGERGKRCGSGLLLVKKDDAVAVGGFNSALDGWGYNDLDFHMRLQVVLGLSVAAAGAVLHLSHGNDKRVVLTGSPRTDHQRNKLTCMNNYIRGDYAGSYRADVETWGERIRQIPRA